MADAIVRRRTNDFHLLQRYWPYARPYKLIITLAFVSIPLVSILGLLNPFLMMHGIDVNLRGEAAHPILESVLLRLGLEQTLLTGTDGIRATAILFLFVVVAEYVFRGLQTYALQMAGHRSVGGLRQHLYRHVSSQSASFFDRTPTGALLTRTTSDIEALGESLSTGVVTIFADLFNLLAISIFMLLLSVKVTLVSFALAPLLILIVNFFRKKLKDSFIKVRKSIAEVNAYLQEQLAGVRIVQLFNQEERSYSVFKGKAINYLRATQLSNIYDASLYAVMEGMATISIALLLWYGGGSVIQGALSLGLLVAFLEYIQRLFVPIKEFSGKFATLQQAVASIERVVELLDTQQKVTPGTHRLESATGRIRFKDVSFGYSEKAGDVLHGISFEVAPRQVVAFVGATGSGKTTVGKLLARMYDGYQGNIELEGYELSSLEVDSVRSKVGVVQQDVILFNGSIAFNISLGNPAISLERVRQAAQLVHAEEFIAALPGGYDFKVAERGANLSAGQAQLLAFARVMAHDPPIVLLDEATASIDSRTEALIQRAIAVILEKKTVLVIAHRLSTIQAADRILVLDQGVIREQGRHEELLQQGGLYAQLYQQGFGEAGNA